MNEPTDIDALIAEARAWTREDAEAAPRNLRRLAFYIADALESTTAELRKSKLRLDEATHANHTLSEFARAAEAELRPVWSGKAPRHADEKPNMDQVMGDILEQEKWEQPVGTDGLTESERSELARRRASRRPSLDGRRGIPGGEHAQ